MSSPSNAPGREPRFPFTAIVGQGRMKLALILNAIDPAVGGVLIRGNKGTAKSTTVRALADLLPAITVVLGCPFGCAGDDASCPAFTEVDHGRRISRPVRIVDLPVGASEERLAGSLDIERALGSGEQAFEPGILAAANRGILYIDEVNLLGDHLIDLLLDASAMGRNYVERDGISVSHAARFMLVGTMNPEEGEIRPQLLDRFGLMVEAEDGMAPADRADVVRRRIAFEADPAGFEARWATAQSELRDRIIAARSAAAGVRVPEVMLEAITTLCAACGVDGLRADIVIYRAAAAHAAWHGRTEVTVEDVREAAALALTHRQRRQPFERPEFDESRIDEALAPFADPPHSGLDEPGEDKDDDDRLDPGDGGGAPGQEDPPPGDGSAGREERASVGEPAALRAPDLRRSDSRSPTAPGRRIESRSDARNGRHISSRAAAPPITDVDVAATLRAAAPYQHRRHAIPGGRVRLRLHPQDVRQKVRLARSAALILFVVDASGSMGAQRRMEAAKGAILALLLDAYQQRDRVGFIAFRGTGARLLLPPVSRAERAHAYLDEIATGGRTPLAEGLRLAAQVIRDERGRDRSMTPLVVLVSDGRANAEAGPLSPAEAAITAARDIRSTGAHALVVDTETGYVRLGLARALAETLGGRCVGLDDVTTSALAEAVRRERSSAHVPVRAR